MRLLITLLMLVASFNANAQYNRNRQIAQQSAIQRAASIEQSRRMAQLTGTIRKRWAEWRKTEAERKKFWTKIIKNKSHPLPTFTPNFTMQHSKASHDDIEKRFLTYAGIESRSIDDPELFPLTRISGIADLKETSIKGHPGFWQQTE